MPTSGYTFVAGILPVHCRCCSRDRYTHKDLQHFSRTFHDYKHYRICLPGYSDTDNECNVRRENPETGIN